MFTSLGIFALALFLAQSPTGSSAGAPAAVSPTAGTQVARPERSESAYMFKDFASNLLSAIAIGIGWYNYRKGLKQGQRTQLLVRLLRSISDLDSKSFALSESVEKNLLGDLGARRKCATDWKELQRLEHDLEVLVSCRSEEIFRAVQEWYHETMSDPYPVQVTDRALEADSAHFEKLRTAQTKLHAFLLNLEDGCILGSVKYWHRKSAGKRTVG